MKEQTIEKMIAFFRENDEIFSACMEELDSYNGYLGEDRYYPMDDLNELYSGTDISLCYSFMFFAV